MNMEGSLVAWFQMLQRQQLIPTWAALAKAVEIQFGPSRFDSPRSRLFKLAQTTSAAVYYTEFLVLSTRVEGLTDDAILDCFVSGLKPSLRRDVMVQGPQTLILAAELAQLYDDTAPYHSSGPQASSRSWHGSPPGYSKPTGGLSRPSLSAIAAAPMSGSSAVSVTESSSPPSPPPYKRLTAAELRAKREKGLCYYCDDKYAPGHKCKPTLFLMLGPEEFSEVFYGTSFESVESECVEDVTPALQTLSPEISLHALEGEFNPRTLRLTGYYKREPLKILVDSGSTLNFLKGSVARCLKLPLTAVTPFRVRTRGGDYLHCTHKCEQVAFVVQDVKLVVDFFVLEIAGMDMVLGVQWLAQLGNVISNYNQLTMSFFHQGKQVTLQGIAKLDVAMLPPRDFRKLVDSGASSGLYALQCINTLQSSTPVTDSVSPILTPVLEEFSSIFKEPSQLPPRRTIDHRIPLLPDAKPINVRPYRYPHFQKAEMEKLVAEMHASGVIRDSTSAFSSPVLLVKKRMVHGVFASIIVH